MYLWLAVVTVLVFGQVIGFDFLLWDDNDYVTDNSFVLKGLPVRNEPKEPVGVVHRATLVRRYRHEPVGES